MKNLAIKAVIQKLEYADIQAGEYYETIKKVSMYFTHDTNHVTIGLIDRS